MRSTLQGQVPSAPVGLPLQAVADALEQWQLAPKPDAARAVEAALTSVLGAHGIEAGELQLDAPPLAPLRLRLGSRTGPATNGRKDDLAWRDRPDVERYALTADRGRVRLGDAWIQGADPARAAAAQALVTAIDLCWSRAEARAASERFDALDAAITAIAAETSLDRILQLIVDRVRPLVGAHYAALGIVGEHGSIERFITSGMDEEVRRSIGHPPVGRGLLGVIIREGRTVRVPDLMTDPRRSGFPPNHPTMHSFLGVPIQVEGLSIGNLYLTDKESGAAFTADDERVVGAFSRHAGVAILKARMHLQLQRMAVLQERERIGQDLHDGVIQSLYGVGLLLEDVGEMMETDAEEAASRAEHAIDLIHATIRDIRSFIFGLRPEYLEDSDLANGLAALADEFRRSTLIDVDLNLSPEATSSPEVAMHVLQLSREALSNVARHSAATRVVIDLAADDHTMRLGIRDNGRGFDTGIVPPSGHRGLGNMRGRAEALGGRLAIDSDSDGTTVLFELPLRTGRRSEESMG